MKPNIWNKNYVIVLYSYVYFIICIFEGEDKTTHFNIFVKII
jgi:hypothetical protein